MTPPVPPPADTPPFPDEADFEMAIAACLHVARHAKEDGFQAFHGRLEQAGDRLRIHLATLAAAQGTARQLERIQKLAKVLRLEDVIDGQQDSETVHLLKNFALVAAAQLKARQAEAAYAALREATQALVEALDEHHPYRDEVAALRAALQGTGESQ